MSDFGKPGRITVEFDLKIVSGYCMQAFAKIVEIRQVTANGPAEYITLASGTSGLISDADYQILMRHAAEDAVRKLENAIKQAREFLAPQRLL